jgi:hypothetical protein
MRIGNYEYKTYFFCTDSVSIFGDSSLLPLCGIRY